MTDSPPSDSNAIPSCFRFCQCTPAIDTSLFHKKGQRPPCSLIETLPSMSTSQPKKYLMKSTHYLLAFIFSCTTAITCCSAIAANDHPNIVLIISDDQAWNDYGFMGHDQIQTPHLDRLAKQSAVFPHGYVPTALCRPSLATLLTGPLCINAWNHRQRPLAQIRGARLKALQRSMRNFDLLPRPLQDRSENPR